MVNRLNCNLGATKNLERRKRDYERTFGAKYVIFQPYAVTEEIKPADEIVLKKLHEYRVKGRTGQLNKWLLGIDPQQARTLALAALDEANIEYTLPDDIT
jgi:hypothetical protein